MKDDVKSLPPVKVMISRWNKVKLTFMAVVSAILWLILGVAVINVLAYYISDLFTKGILNPETVQYAIIVAVGAYFCLILDKNKIYEALNIKRDLPYIESKAIDNRKRSR